MHKFFKAGVILTLLVVFAAVSASGITRVSRSLNVIDFNAGYAKPWGSYDGTVGRDFLINDRPVDIDVEDLYEPTFFFGFNYGSVRRGHLMYQLGFRYYNHRMIDTVQVSQDTIVYFGIDYSLRQYDLDFNFNYLINDLNFNPWSPYLGVGFHAGITTLSAKGYESENEAELALSINYGLDVRIWKKRDNESFITLSSINNINFWATEDRPKYFNFGLGLKYFFEM